MVHGLGPMCSIKEYVNVLLNRYDSFWIFLLVSVCIPYLILLIPGFFTPTPRDQKGFQFMSQVLNLEEIPSFDFRSRMCGIKRAVEPMHYYSSR